MRRALTLLMTLSLPVTTLAQDEASTGTSLEQDMPSPIQRLAELRLDEFVVPARMINLPLPGRTQTLQDVLKRMHEWASDDGIGGVLLDVGNVGLGLADIQELRDGISALHAADKSVVAFLNGSGPMGYLLACQADEVVVPPVGGVSIPGIGGTFAYLKGHYQMLGFEFDVITAGRYKYPGFLNEREPNDHFMEEYGAILDGLITDYKAIIAEGRDMPLERIDEAVDIAMFSAEDAQKFGLVDRIAYYDECRDRLLKTNKFKRYHDSGRGLAHINSIQDFMELINEQLQKAAEASRAVGPKLAVLHARGPIVDLSLGTGFSSQMICRDDFIKVVDQLRRNKSIKGVVLRIDSPGGSAFASDAIWKALRRLDDTKPLVVSMGTVAGSGGYYIACPARRIFAQPTTITGSIGVLSIFQNAWSFFNRSDYEIAEMKRGARSTLGSPHRSMSHSDRAFIQDHILTIYDIFIDRVATTRRMPDQQVRELAEGRIYTGRQALDIGLVDELGGLADAIEATREMAGIPASAELKILDYPRPSSLGELFESLSSVGVTQGVELLAKANAPVQPMSFEDQLRLFSAQHTALCWMAVPDYLNGYYVRNLALEQLSK